MSSTAATSNFRVYDLPWTPSPEEERRFRRVRGAALGLFIAFGLASILFWGYFRYRPEPKAA